MDLRQAEADQKFVEANVKVLHELESEVRDLLDIWLPEDVAYINLDLTGYEKNRNANHANTALDAIQKTVHEIFNNLNMMTGDQSPYRDIEARIKAHAAQMRARRAAGQ